MLQDDFPEWLTDVTTISHTVDGGYVVEDHGASKAGERVSVVEEQCEAAAISIPPMVTMPAEGRIVDIVQGMVPLDPSRAKRQPIRELVGPVHHREPLPPQAFARWCR